MVMKVYLRSIMILIGTLEDDRTRLHFIQKAEILYKSCYKGNDEKKVSEINRVRIYILFQLHIGSLMVNTLIC